MPIVLLIPGIVIAELDYQKNCKHGVAFESRKASEWLAGEIRSGQGIIKGQAYSQTLLPSGDWRQRAGVSATSAARYCILMIVAAIKRRADP